MSRDYLSALWAWFDQQEYAAVMNAMHGPDDAMALTAYAVGLGNVLNECEMLDELQAQRNAR